MSEKIDFTKKHEDLLMRNEKKINEVAQIASCNSEGIKANAEGIKANAEGIKENGKQIHRLGLEFEQQQSSINVILENIISINERMSRWEEEKKQLNNHEYRISAVESYLKELRPPV